MEEVGAAFLSRILRRDPDSTEITAFVDEYVREWNTAVVYPPGVTGLIGALADRFRLAVVTNIHKADLVPGNLSAMGIAHHFDAVVTAVDVGRRKPHPSTYAEAVLRLSATADNVVFAGDSCLAQAARGR